jgi:hypothetical protein
MKEKVFENTHTNNYGGKAIIFFSLFVQHVSTLNWVLQRPVHRSKENV